MSGPATNEASVPTDYLEATVLKEEVEDRSARSAIKWVAMLPAVVVVGVAAGVFAIWRGVDTNWDLRNYHYYNPYAFLTGRLGQDFAPAQIQSYINPLLDIPIFLAIQSLPPRAVGFLLGFVHALNAVPLVAITRATLPGARTPEWSVAVLVIAGAGLVGAQGLSEIGTTLGDDIVSILILMAIALPLSRYPRLHAGSRTDSALVAGLTGFLAGIALGLKQPVIIYAAGLLVAFGFTGRTVGRRVWAALWCGLGTIAGTTATAGYWFIEMCHRFGNPVFPFLNQIFLSPSADSKPYFDERFVAHGLREIGLAPFLWTTDPFRVGELPFRDLRIPIVYGFLLVLAVRAGFRYATGTLDRSNRFDGRARFLLVSLGSAYVSWILAFGYYRFLLPIEMVAPLGLVLAIERLFRGRSMWRYAAAGLLAIVVGTVRPADYGHRQWSESYFDVAPPPLDDPGRSLVLMTGYEATAFVIPFFPPAASFVRIEGTLNAPLQDRVRQHIGTLYVLHELDEDPTAKLAKYGLNARATECRQFPSGAGLFTLCPVDR